MKSFKYLLLLTIFNIALSYGQDNYHATPDKINDLVHTKLKVAFNFEKSQMYGEAWLTLTPHFYPVQELILDAKAMLIEHVSSNGKNLIYNYDSKKLKIDLTNTYSKGEKYTIYIKYIARPEEIKSEGSAVITDEKGLYFIDPLETNPDKPTEIWTQGATESSSVWFPTIDAPNQKTSQEIYMTVPSKYVSLSNGLLVSQKDNHDGTRTDYWKMDEKHAPYLFFMGVGDFSIIKDTYKGKPVNYYVDKEYAPYAQEIFGKTPEMMEFFSTITGVEYPWVKYSQMVGIDFVSGAMENTTATLHSESVYQTSGDLIDENIWEDTIAHELFHQWFGDYVTTESWSNITVNESFANYSEYLWREYKYGKDHADAHRYEEVQRYLSGKNYDKHLVRFNYDDEMEVFDLVSYQKGGAILHNLRNYLGDKAFFAGLKKYLEANKFGTAEAHQLRLALEEVSGKDLNWFFNQWYFGNGHPKLEISYSYDYDNKQVVLNILQNDKTFNFPVKIAVYENNKPKIYKVWVNKKTNRFAFDAKTEPKFVDFDVDKTLIMEVVDNKQLSNYIYQYQFGESYENRREAIEKIAKETDKKEAARVLISALEDDYYGLRIKAINSIDLSKKQFKATVSKVENIALHDKKTLVRAAALRSLAVIAKETTIFEEAMKSKSYSVKRSALEAIYKLDKKKALQLAKSIMDERTKNSMKDALIAIYVDNNDKLEYNFIAKNVLKGMFFSKDPVKQNLYQKAFQLIGTSEDLSATAILVNSFVKAGLQYKQYGVDKVVTQLLQQVVMYKNELHTSNKQELLDVVNNGIKKLK